jgi:quinol monooxygenase YgiN
VVIVIARFRPRPDLREDLVALLEEIRGASRQPHVGRLIAALPELGDEGLEIAAHEVAPSGPLPIV